MNMTDQHITTAIARKLAHDAEDAREFSRAAALYDHAADIYPQPYPKLGALAEKDIAMLRQAARLCRMAVES